MRTGNFKAYKRIVKYKLLFYFVKGVIHLSNFLPRKTWLWFCGNLGKLVFEIAPKLRKQIRDHLSLAYKHEKTPDEITALSRNVLIMMGKNAGLVLRESQCSTDNFYKESIVHGEEHAKEAFSRGHGVIFLTAHLGPFECIAHDLSLRGYHPFIVGTPLKDPLLNNLLTQNRTKFGAVAIERGKETYRVMKNITTGGTMAILIDQDTRVKSVFVNFFGRECSTPVGATVLALKTGAAIIPVFAHLNEDGISEIDYYPEVTITKTGNEEEDLVNNTQTLTSIIEREIRKFPDQWVWMHRRWKTMRSTPNELAEASL